MPYTSKHPAPTDYHVPLRRPGGRRLRIWAQHWRWYWDGGTRTGTSACRRVERAADGNQGDQAGWVGLVNLCARFQRTTQYLEQDNPRLSPTVDRLVP